ncbi:MAG: hypothetical protein A2648_01580 [Candidatus Lloydbacteria bacterium RIFCSPHIGHO2_01_FULL_41_20]|uniref:FAD/NAD(P)-binding domain-containing protein n=1 Tax=Candidatus Lloydbacteria bacterium RIFCSPHIGHO2_01_FULL_41_20 TaxID=1798657 RepID=A0A1G2CVI9_9BACT|nr:MAG: hypothetical protein A2648_01580 [Candidatus Lloydbacteria bacterium RIFCSPHIGHO2_01_FULL_41_20]
MELFDLIIIGAGPAGTAAGIYASRKKLKSLLITPEFGGQSVVSEDIQNWVGTPSISGVNLAASFKAHLTAYAGNTLTIKEGEKVLGVSKENSGFSIKTDRGNIYGAKTIFIASGSGRRKLEVPGADRLEHKGITYCASCDGPLFDGQDVAVIGGGNAGFETAAQLLAYTKSVTLLNHSVGYKADPITIEKVLRHPKMKAFDNVDVVEIKGEKFVSSLAYKNNKTGAMAELPVAGIFVEIGQIPNTDFIKELVLLDNYGRIKVDPRTQATSLTGIWAAGDATDVLYHQNNIAAGDAVRAVEDLYLHLHT